MAKTRKFGVRPEKEEALFLKMQSLGIREEDLLETFARASGPGGQKINKTSSCVRLQHVPSGREVKVQQSRSQALNRFLARRLLCERFEEIELGKDSPQNAEKEKVRKQKMRRLRRTKRRLDRAGDS